MPKTPSYFDDPARQLLLVGELESWLGTPFALRGTVKGQGVDCVCFVAEVMVALGVIDGYAFPRYSLDWAKHRDESLVLAWLDACPQVTKVPEGEPIQIGDVACFKFGRCVHHCGVMLDALRMIHALERLRVERGQLDDSTWADRLVCAYRPLPK